MRNSFLLAALFVVAAGCAPYPNNFSIEKFYPIIDECDIEEGRDSSFSPNGFLDVSPGNPQFFIGIQIGGIGAMAPERRRDLARLGGRALFVGFVATLVNAAIAGVLL